MDVSDRLSILLNKDGIYLCEIKFEQEDHAFIIIVDKDRMTVLNRYNSFHSIEHDLTTGLGSLLLLERNTDDNKSLIEEFMDIELLYDRYMILALTRCTYWEKGFTSNDLANFFVDVLNTSFDEREESNELSKIIEELRDR